jgi:hypothetical protein
MHTLLTDIEAAATAPAKAKFPATAVAGKALYYSAFAPGSWFCGRVFHCCCFKILLI